MVYKKAGDMTPNIIEVTLRDASSSRLTKSPITIESHKVPTEDGYKRKRYSLQPFVLGSASKFCKETPLKSSLEVQI